MFLEVKKAECTALLDKLVHMVEMILDYSVRTLFQELDEGELTELIEEDLRCLLRYKKVHEAVEALFKLPYHERLHLCEAFTNDKEFQDHIRDGAYRFWSLTGKEAAVLRELCESLYMQVSSGFPGDGEAFSIGLLNRQFARGNGKLGNVCPVCVRELLFDYGEGQADHYFPRGKYPSLILHPANILPTCPECNGPRNKFKKDPIDRADAGKGELLTVFLPYLRAARPEVAFEVSEDSKREIRMKPGPKADAYTERRIENMERLYGLGKRWSRVLDHVYEDLMAELTAGCSRVKSEREWLCELRGLLRAHAGSTKDRPDFVKGIYCGWLQTKTDEELRELFPRPQKLPLGI